MSRLINYLKVKLHIHHYNTPIASQYRSFNTRNIIYKCRCGHKEVFKVTAQFGEPFPIQTNMLITNEEFNKKLR